MLCGAIALTFAAACDGDDSAPAPSVVPPTATAAPSATPQPPLGDLIGERAQLPPNDAIDLAQRFGLTSERAAEAKPFAGEANVGDVREFIVANLSDAAIAGTAPPSMSTVRAELLAKSAHAYWYVDQAAGADAGSAEEAARLFEEQTWPAVTAVFGEPLSPGVDGDPRIIVLQADLGGVGGYQSDDDRWLRVVRPQSNEAEMVYMDNTLRLGGAAFNVVLAHELQHLVHGTLDQGEESWTNEGLSETASGLVGGAQSSIRSFEARPETQLNHWDSARSLPHYGAGAAFYQYLAGRFGGDTVLGAIARQQGDGAAGVEGFLASIDQPASFARIYADFVAANLLNAAEVPFANPRGARDMRIERDLATGATAEDAAPQFGTHYYSLLDLDAGAYELRFDGADSVPALAAIDAAHPQAWWSNAGDDVDSRLTREVDLTEVTDPVLRFSTWYDIEGWFDWGYVAVSIDGGDSWTALPGERTIDDDPVTKAYGPGYTRRSGGDAAAWVEESVDLAAYAGQKILLRFEYITDGATHGRGWAIDDIRIDGTDLDDRGADDAAWTADGWVSVDAPLPQTWMVRLIASTAGGGWGVVDMVVDSAGNGVFGFDDAGELIDPVLAIAGTTEGTNETAPYRIELVRRQP